MVPFFFLRASSFLISHSSYSSVTIIELEEPLSDHKPIWAQIVFPRDLEVVK